PDEYSAIVDDNVYTNLMAERNLREAADAAERHEDGAERLGVDDDEIAAWRNAAEVVHVPFDERLGIHAQDADFTQHDRWDFEATPADHYPLLLHYPYFEIYRKQVVKQADLVMALFTRGDVFSAEEKRRAFDYYEERTVRDSSLSACIQSIVAAEVGHMELAYDYLAEAALMDLHDLEHNVLDGVHIASLGGALIAVIAGLAGMRHHGRGLAFAPRLPAGIDRLAFRVAFRDRRLSVEIAGEEATYELSGDGDAAEIEHWEETIALEPGESATVAIPAVADTDPPDQPWGRAPARHANRR
ncbi:MAG: glycosyl hydrolase family 65 protein, partial [Solirubrobacterales bacterium]